MVAFSERTESGTRQARRRFLQVGGLAGTAAFLAACRASESTTSSSSSGAASSKPAPAPRRRCIDSSNLFGVRHICQSRDGHRQV